jgi:hypothetical protein
MRSADPEIPAILASSKRSTTKSPGPPRHTGSPGHADIAPPESIFFNKKSGLLIKYIQWLRRSNVKACIKGLVRFVNASSLCLCAG